MQHLFSFPALRLVVLFSLLTGAAYAQPIPRAEADSLLQLLGNGKADTNRVNHLIRLGEYQVYKPGEFKADMDSARTYAGQAQGLSRQLKYYLGEGRSLNLLGTISREAKELEQSVGYHQAALQLYRRHGDWQGEADSYLRLAWAHRDKGDAPGARKEVQKAIDLYTMKGYPKGVAQAYIELGNTYASWGEERKERIRHYEHALQLYTQTGNKKRQADVLKDLGDLHLGDGSIAQALLELRKALALYQSIQYRELQGVYDLLGIAFSILGDYQEALRHALLAVKTAEQLSDTTLQLCTIYNRVGLIYFSLNQYQKAYSYYQKSLHVALKYQDHASIISLMSNTAGILQKLHKPQEALKLLQHLSQKYPPRDRSDSIVLGVSYVDVYNTLKQYELGQRYCDQLLFFLKTTEKNELNQYYIQRSLIRFFIASRQHEAARKHLSALELLTTGANNLARASFVQLYWFRLDSMEGNYSSAIRHYQQHKILEDSLLNKAKNRQIASLDLQYETEKKEQDLKLKEQSIKVLTRERLLQAKQIEQDKLVRNSLMGGAMLLLLLLGVIYNRYRLKQRSNQALQAQQAQINQQNEHLSELLLEKDSLLGEKDTLLEEKEGLLKEIHHRVKNNLQVVMSLLNSQAASLADKAALSAIRESQHRVQAMALIHQKLYQSQGLARIPMPDYVKELVSYLRDSYRLSHPVRFRLQVEPIELDVTQAVPLGLILNEAVTNACKYAFPGGRAGTVSVSLLQLPGTAPATYQLRIEDDGVGLPEGFNPARSRSLGMTLLHGFSRQLKGKLTLGGPPGLSISLTFAEEKLTAALPTKAASDGHSPPPRSRAGTATHGG